MLCYAMHDAEIVCDEDLAAAESADEVRVRTHSALRYLFFALLYLLLLGTALIVYDRLFGAEQRALAVPQLPQNAETEAHGVRAHIESAANAAAADPMASATDRSSLLPKTAGGAGGGGSVGVRSISTV